MSRALTSPRTQVCFRPVPMMGEVALFVTVPEGEAANPGERVAIWSTLKAAKRLRAELDRAIARVERGAKP